jgi:hypothetical protein
MGLILSGISVTGVSNSRIFSAELSCFQGHAVVQLVEALHYKPEDRGFSSRWSN